MKCSGGSIRAERLDISLSLSNQFSRVLPLYLLYKIAIIDRRVLRFIETAALPSEKRLKRRIFNASFEVPPAVLVDRHRKSGSVFLPFFLFLFFSFYSPRSLPFQLFFRNPWSRNRALDRLSRGGLSISQPRSIWRANPPNHRYVVEKL